MKLLDTNAPATGAEIQGLLDGYIEDIDYRFSVIQKSVDELKTAIEYATDFQALLAGLERLVDEVSVLREAIVAGSA